MPKANIILTGFMGTGKTTVGKLLAHRLGYRFVDTDELIQERSGKTIPEIFQEMGESAFRRMEAEIARELAAGEGLVVATGGRLMLDPENAEVLGRRGRVFCLQAAPEEIVARVTGDAGVARPLLEGDDPLTRIRALLRERGAGYARFPQVWTSGSTPEEVAGRLLDACQADLQS
jgi:shikimate kinase